MMRVLVLLAVCACAIGCGDGDDDNVAADGFELDDDAVDDADDDSVDDSDDDLDDDSDDDTDDDVDDDADDDTDDDLDDDVDDDTDDDLDDDADDDADDDIEPIPTSVSGRVYRFDWTFGHLEGASVEIFERPDLTPVPTDADGAFTFEDAHAEQDNSIVTRHRDFWPTQTATVVPLLDGIDDMAVQIPPRLIVRALSLVLWERLEPSRCQIATTVTEADATPFSPGLAGAVVTIDPPLPADSGPFYFEIIEIPGWPMIDIPRRDLTETTGDGGAIFVNVPEGEYVLSATRAGDVFTSARVKCRAGFLVNAAPPYGLSIVNPKEEFSE